MPIMYSIVKIFSHSIRRLLLIVVTLSTLLTSCSFLYINPFHLEFHYVDENQILGEWICDELDTDSTITIMTLFADTFTFRRIDHNGLLMKAYKGEVTEIEYLSYGYFICTIDKLYKYDPQSNLFTHLPLETDLERAFTGLSVQADDLDDNQIFSNASIVLSIGLHTDAGITSDFNQRHYRRQNKLLAIAGDPLSISCGDVAYLDGTESKSSDNIDSYDWSVVSFPPGGSFELLHPTTARPVLSPNDVGAYLIRLNIISGNFHSMPDYT